MNLIKCILSAFLFGIATPFSKELLEAVHPVLLASLFYLGAAIILFPKTLHLQKYEPIKKPSRQDIKNLLGSLFFGGLTGPLLLLFGLSYTSATSASLLLNLETTATTFLAWYFFKENIGLQTWIASIGIVMSGVILTFKGTFTPGIGGILIALACISWGLDNNYTASIHNIDPVRSTFIKGFTIGLVNLCIALFLINGWPDFSVILLALLIGAFSYGLSIVLYISAARNIGAARSQMIFASAPFMGVAISQIYLGESLLPHQGISMIFMIVMLLLLFLEKHRHLHTHTYLKHNHQHTHTDDHHRHIHEKKSANNKNHGHEHTHTPEKHSHPHHPDLHHRHDHK